MNYNLWYLIVIVFISKCSSALSWPNYERHLGEEDCCPLVFLPLTSSGKIPKDAILGGETQWDFEKIYYVQLDFYYSYNSNGVNVGKVNRPGHWVGYKTARPGSYVRFHWKNWVYECRNNKMYLLGDSSNYVYGNCYNTDIKILSNPYHCALDYWERTYRYQEPIQAWDIFYPYIGHQYFARRYWDEVDNSYTGAGVMDKVNEYSKEIEKWYGEFHECHYYNKDVWDSANKGTQVLYINCTESIGNILQSEVIKFDVRFNNFFTSHNPITLSRNIYVNVQGKNVEYKKTVSHQLTTTIHMTKEDQSRWLNRIGTRTSIEPAITKEFSKLGSNLQGMTSFNYEKEWEQLVKNGTSITTSKATTITDEVNVVVPPCTKVTLLFLQYPITGKLPFTAKLKITSVAKEMTPEAIIRALERIGNTNSRIENGYVIVDVEGFLRVEYGWNTNSTTEFEPLTHLSCN